MFRCLTGSTIFYLQFTIFLFVYFYQRKYITNSFHDDTQIAIFRFFCLFFFFVERDYNLQKLQNIAKEVSIYNHDDLLAYKIKVKNSVRKILKDLFI